MEECVFVCIGTNKLLEDSLGPRIGERLKNNFKNHNKVKIFGTMNNPVHFKNAHILCDKLKGENTRTILIDSAFGKQEHIGNSFINLGGLIIGKAYGKSFYFPADLNIKTVIGTEEYLPNWEIEQIENLAESVANVIIKSRIFEP